MTYKNERVHFRHECVYAHHAHNLDVIALTRGSGPQNIIQNVQRQCFWCIAAKLTWRRLSVAAYGCALLLLVTFALHELAVS